MPTYRVKIGFWLRAYDSVEIDASDGEDAIARARKQALHAMQETGHPEHIETDERREGLICWIDRLGAPLDDATIAEAIDFDDDRIHGAPVASPSR